MKPSDFLIRHECPQCGAPAILEETDRLFQCAYCRVKSYLLQKDFFRYVIPHHAPENADILYVPYWRFRGSVFSCVADGIQERFADISHQAVDSSYFPESLGFRTQALKLQFLSPEISGHFFKPTLKFKAVINLMRDESESILYQQVIGETISLIYAPFYLQENILYDAVLNKPCSSEPFLFEKKAGESKPDWQIRFIAAICPNCGHDLDGERNTLTLLCSTCNCIWHTGKQGLEKLAFTAIPASWEDAAWLPFWRIKADVSGIELTSQADMIRLANLPKVISKEHRDMLFYFWIPAFKVQPYSFLRFARSMTLFQPQDELISELPKGKIYPVTLPNAEAAQSLKIHLAGFIKPKKSLKEKLRNIDIAPKESLLIYVPFQQKHHELIQPDSLISVHKNLLIAGENL